MRSVHPAFHCFTCCDTSSSFSEGEELPWFQHFRSTEASNKLLNAWGKIISAETLLDEKNVCCMYGKATFLKVNQLRYVSLSQKYQGTSVHVLFDFNCIVFLLVKLSSFSYLQSIT